MGHRLREPAVEAVEGGGNPGLRDAGRNAVAAHGYVAIGDQGGTGDRVPDHHFRLGRQRGVVRGNDVAVGRRRIRGICRDGRERQRAVGILQLVGGVGERGREPGRAAADVVGRRLGDCPDVGGDEGRQRLAVVEDIGA